jgi:hypothetical protein
MIQTLGDENSFKDRQQVKEFLRGSEPNDNKIESVIEFLGKVDDNFKGILEDDDFEELVADIFSQLIRPNVTDIDMPSISSKLDNFVGVYERLEVHPQSHLSSKMELLHVGHTINTQYLSVSMLKVDWRSHPETASTTDQTLAGCTPMTISELVRDTGQPYYIGAEDAYRQFAQLIRKNDQSNESFINAFYRGTNGYMFFRDDSHFLMIHRNIADLSALLCAGEFLSFDTIRISELDLHNIFSPNTGADSVSQHPVIELKRVSKDVEDLLSSYIAAYGD